MLSLIAAIVEREIDITEVSPLVPIAGLVFLILVLAGYWQVFVKAGQPGWGILIPIYNMVLMMRVAGRPGWWVVLMLIPIVGFIVGIVITSNIATNFGKGLGFTMGLIFFPYVF